MDFAQNIKQTWSRHSARSLPATRVRLARHASDRAEPPSLAGSKRIVILQSWRVLLSGLIAGAAAGLGMVAAVSSAQGLLIGAVAFLTSPILVAILLTQPPQTAGEQILVLASALLYATYAFIACTASQARTRMLWLVGLLLIHAACLITFGGLIIIIAIARAV